jgi:hypothetical protein
MMNDDPDVSVEQTAILALVGVTLLATQTTEQMMSLCLTHILQLDGTLTLETLERVQAKKRTIGQVLQKMRARIDIEERFDDILSEFLESRNLLAHRLRDVPGWDLNDPKGIATAYRFLRRMEVLNSKISGTFGGLARAWSRETGGPLFPVVHGSDQAEKIIDFIFYKKESAG